jgi:N-methylhydantoinase B
MTAIYAADGTTIPPRGVHGGTDAEPVASRKRLASGEVIDLPAFNEEVCRAGETLMFHAAGGGGYGDPLQRPPERVAASVNRGWLTAAKAREVYKVALVLDPDEGTWRIDRDETRFLRA